MKHSGLMGAGGHAHRAHGGAEQAHADEFSAYAELGSDGVGYIATVQSSPEQAEAITSELKLATDRAWGDFIAASA